MARLPKAGRVAWICGALAAAGAAGFTLGIHQRDTIQRLAVQQPIPLEFYLTEASFSEVENTKAKLDALCSQFLTELRARTDPGVLAANALKFSTGLPAVDPARMLKQIQTAIVEFKGTEQEMVLVRELLSVLKRSKLYDRWLDVYLDLLYAHPTEPLISKFANDAIQIGAASGRERELENGFQLLEHIPARIPPNETPVTSVSEGTPERPVGAAAVMAMRQSSAPSPFSHQ